MITLRYAQKVPPGGKGEDGAPGADGADGAGAGSAAEAAKLAALAKPPRYVTSSGATLTVRGSGALIVRVVLEADVELILSGFRDGQKVSVAFTQDGTGGWAVTWPASVRWPGGAAPVVTPGAGKRDVFGFEYWRAVGEVDAGFDGFTIGQDL